MARVLLALFVAGAAVVGGLTLYVVWPSLPWTDDGHPGRSAPLHAPELGASLVVLYVPGLEFDLGADDLNRPDAYTRRVFPLRSQDCAAQPALSQWRGVSVQRPRGTRRMALT